MRSLPHPDWITPDWPAGSRVHALITTRDGGVSSGKFASLNLSMRVGDDPRRVARNRAILRACLPAEPAWVKQVHGTAVIDAARATPDAEADGIVTQTPGRVCAVMVADCLPVLLSDREGKSVGIAHAGWRGLAGGIVENVVQAMGVPRLRGSGSQRRVSRESMGAGSVPRAKSVSFPFVVTRPPAEWRALSGWRKTRAWRRLRGFPRRPPRAA